MFEKGLSYNFNTLSPSKLGLKFSNAVVIGEKSSPILYNIPNLYTTNEMLMKDIPNLDSDFNTHNIIVFSVDGETVYLSEQWIDLETIVCVDSLILQYTIHDTDDDQRSVIDKALKELGIKFTRITI